ncbi:MAG: DNA alkylation repair protein [Sphaerochaetaceae bacterium]|jgi:3-methyladenine DNA glycosylase AlkD
MLQSICEIRAELESLSDPVYREFSSSLVPGSQDMLGVRIPDLRRIAKRIAAVDPLQYLDQAPETCFEETLIKGLIIGYMKQDLEVVLDQIRLFVPKISSWSVCDSTCSTLKIARKNQDVFWDFLMPYLDSDRTYDVRFAVVMLMDYFIDSEHIDRVLRAFQAIGQGDYYVKMAVAWALSVCYAKFPEKTLALLSECTLDDDTFSKTVQKICESFRVDETGKEAVRTLKRRKKRA